ncbi:hypothetical protein TrRE_jg13375 [Triparma retinervis]|uniref:Sepiapterin reductase n=1 Tax=Triparma retinervis TaxID=2557542 RepID=A0A9W6Z8D6_9STRA|nr:hypothetical protein TrRE_jg13375 [Triparma retinervis]
MVSKTWGVYCTCKSARDMYHRTLAMENGGLKVVSYAPGAMDTDMQGVIRGSEGCDEELREYFKKSKEEGTLVDPLESASKLTTIIFDKEFKSGAHIDYWDEV